MNSKLRSQATYYIRIDTFWQNSPDRFVGPFASRAEAQAAIDETYDHEDSNIALPGIACQDVKSGIRVHKILSKSSARRAGMRDYALGDDTSNVLDAMPLDAGDMADMEQERDSYYAY